MTESQYRESIIKHMKENNIPDSEYINFVTPNMSSYKMDWSIQFSQEVLRRTEETKLLSNNSK